MTLSHLPLGSQRLESLLSFSNFSFVGLLKVGRDLAKALAPVAHRWRQGLQHQGMPELIHALPADRQGSRPERATLKSRFCCSEVLAAERD